MPSNQPPAKQDSIDLFLAVGPSVVASLATWGLPLVGVLAWHGLLGASLAVVGAATAGARTTRKLRDFEDAVAAGLALDSFRQDVAEGDVEALSRTVAQLGERLNAHQAQDLAELVEQCLRSSDERWLEYLRRAAKQVAAKQGVDPERHVIIRRLRDLTPEHVDRLRGLASAGREPLPPMHDGPGTVDDALIGAGFASLERDRDPPLYAHHDELGEYKTDRGRLHVALSSLGDAALELLAEAPSQP